MTDWMLTPEEQMAGATLGPAPERARRPLLVGESNPYSAKPEAALFPHPRNSAGARLCFDILGFRHAAEYLRTFDRCDLCGTVWRLPDARARAAEIAGGDRPLVLLGAKVCQAFNVTLRWLAFELNAEYAEMARRRLRQQGIAWPTQPPAVPTEEDMSPRPEPPAPARAATERREPRAIVSCPGPDATGLPVRREPPPPKRLTIILADGTETHP